MPWKISASFTLNGPDVSVSDVSDASGMIGIRIALHATKPDVTANLTPIVAFTIPGRVGSDVTADDGVLVSSDNTSTLVAAVGKPGEDLTFNAYVTAKHFTMSSLSIAAVEGNVQQSLPDLTKRATTLVDGLTNVGSQRNRKLIAQLEQLRDNEKALAKQTIAVRSKAHDQAFDGYIDAYVGSYTTHLSGSIGNATQLPAILGTASELNGDTSVAKSVADLANAVNDVSAAYRHIGAADAVDEVIRTIEQRGTSGLVNELTKRAGEEQQRGSKDYSAGQSQLSAAMIPYSMDFTDAYTARLKELGATAGTAGSYETQAIADVRAGIKDNEKLKTASDKVSAAMTALADAASTPDRPAHSTRSCCDSPTSWIQMTTRPNRALPMTLLCWTRCVPPPPANRCARKPRNGGPVRNARPNARRRRTTPPIRPAWSMTRTPSAWMM